MQELISIVFTRQADTDDAAPPADYASRTRCMTDGTDAPLAQFSDVRPVANATTEDHEALPASATDTGVIHDQRDVRDAIEAAWDDYRDHMGDRIDQLRAALAEYDTDELLAAQQSTPDLAPDTEPTNVRHAANEFGNPDHFSTTLFDEHGNGFHTRDSVGGILALVPDPEIDVFVVPCHAEL